MNICGKHALFTYRRQACWNLCASFNRTVQLTVAELVATATATARFQRHHAFKCSTTLSNSRSRGAADLDTAYNLKTRPKGHARSGLWFKMHVPLKMATGQLSNF